MQYSGRETANIGPWWILTFTLALALYAATASRGPQWQDSGYYILRAVTGELVNPLGLAMSHPLHYWLSRTVIWPGFFEPCLAVTLISAAGGALAVANVCGCVMTLTGRRAAALSAAVGLAVANTFWQMATRAEMYTLTTGLLAGECWCIAAYARSHRSAPLCLAWLLNGLGLANHLLAILTVPTLAGVTVFGLSQGHLRYRHLLGAGFLWLAASSPYTGLVALRMMESGEVTATLASALFGKNYASAVLNVVPSLSQLVIAAGFPLFNFPNAALLFGAVGVMRAGRAGVAPAARWALTAALVLHFAFAARYNVVDQHSFFLPSYTIFAIFGGIGFAYLLRVASEPGRQVLIVATVASLVWTPLLYALVPVAARTPAGSRLLARVGFPQRDKPYRDDYVYAFIPWSVVERSAERMSREAVELAGDNGMIIVEDRMGSFAVRYQVHRLQRAGVEIVEEASAAVVEPAAAVCRPVVLVPREVASPPDPPVGRWRPVGDLYMLETGTCPAPD